MQSTFRVVGSGQVQARRAVGAGGGQGSAETSDAESWESSLIPGTAEMTRLMEQVRRVAPQNANVLLEGETGTGKTRLARLIHDLSPRRAEPYLVVNCGALAESLIESEMFGHVRGAFTGADRDRVGKFAEVGSGTLLLDDIDGLPLTLQAKLLRAVEERIFEPVGSNAPQPMQARLIVASSRALEREVAAGRFRADLFFRLNVVSFTLPPLRERRAAIRPLVFQFIAESASRNGREVYGITGDALSLLERYPWPGNIRELRNMIERSVAFCGGREIEFFDLPETLRVQMEEAPPAPMLPPAVPPPAARSSLAQTKEAAEMARIIEALHRHRDNRLRAARELGISRMTLYKKMHKYGLMTPANAIAAEPGSPPAGLVTTSRNAC